MKLRRKPSSAFTLIELLIVITIIGILAGMAIPAAMGVMARGQMTGTLANARQLHMVTQQMSLDNFNAGEGIQWTTDVSSGNNGGTPISLATYFGALTNQGAYLQPKELVKLLTAPGVIPQAGNLSANNIAFRVFPVNENSPSDQPFVTTRNWNNRALDPKASPYGNKGFVLFTKGGGGNVYTITQAGSTNLFPQDNTDSATYNYNSIQ